MISFEQYDEKNPEIWKGFKRLAFDAIYSGQKRWGAKGIMEVLRWDTAVRAKGDNFKINNN